MNPKEVFIGMDHIAIRCPDVQKSIRFYTEVLGFEYEGHKDTNVNGSIAILHYVVKGGVRLELSEYKDMSRFSQEGIVNHICLEVSDINAAWEYLGRQEDCKILVQGIFPPDKPLFVEGYFYCFFITGPSGEKIEIAQNL